MDIFRLSELGSDKGSQFQWDERAYAYGDRRVFLSWPLFGKSESRIQNNHGIIFIADGCNQIPNATEAIHRSMLLSAQFVTYQLIQDGNRYAWQMWLTYGY